MTERVWALEVSDNGPTTYLGDERAYAAISAGGLCPRTVRDGLAMRDSPLTLELVKPDGLSVYDEPVPVGDILQCNWFPLFSERAIELLVALGCAEEEFIECRLRVLPRTSYKAHLPLKHYDIIDFPRSIARHEIPVNPPIPFYFERVSLKGSTSGLPPCFRVPAPGHAQVLSELFALDTLHDAWEQARLEGARFRLLSGDAP